MHTIRKNI